MIEPLISDKYRKLNTELHKGPGFGGGGHRRKKEVVVLIKEYQPTTILDYGCGKGKLAESMPQYNWSEYDPCVPGKNRLPEPADIVICSDVLEHVEIVYVKSVIRHVHNLTKKAAFFVIGLSRANKTLPDGRNTHITILPKKKWMKYLKAHFEIITRTQRGKKIFIVGVPK